MSKTFSLTIAGMTDTGKVRTCNEDAIAWDEQLSLVLLADGMGGHNAGDVASQMAVDLLMQSMRSALKQGSKLDDKAVKKIILTAINDANNEIYTTSQEDQQCANMGTTLVLALIHGNQLFAAHIGDSRLYRLRAGKFGALTTDHSLVEQLIKDGTLTKEEAKASRYKNVITRALGHSDTVDAELQQFDVNDGDVYVLCSDGLYGLVDSDELHKALVNKNNEDWDQVTEELTNLANARGGTDNISVITIKVNAIA